MDSYRSAMTVIEEKFSWYSLVLSKGICLQLCEGPGQGQ